MTYNVACLEQLAERLEVDKQLVENLLRSCGVGLFFLELSSQMQNLVHDDEQVVAAPLAIVFDDVSHDAIDLGDHLHLDEFVDLDLT